jgi:hypothetical protein
MAESRKRSNREVRLAFDRLLATKLQQVYEILVSDRVRVTGNCSMLNGETNESRGNLREGIVGQAEGREDHSESDRGAEEPCAVIPQAVRRQLQQL